MFHPTPVCYQIISFSIQRAVAQSRGPVQPGAITTREDIRGVRWAVERIRGACQPGATPGPGQDDAGGDDNGEAAAAAVHSIWGHDDTADGRSIRDP